MANTGNQVVINLRKKNLTTGTLVVPAVYKANIPGDPDYIAPGANPAACPIDTTLNCPVVRAAKKEPDKIQYEFSLPESVLANAAVAKITVIIYRPGPVTEFSKDYTDFTINYFRDISTSLALGYNYSMAIQYKNSVGTVIGGCEGLISVMLDSVITWEGMAPACQTYPTCAAGWTLDSTGTQCEQVTTAPPDAPTGGGGSPGVVEHVSNDQWNNGGARVYQVVAFPHNGDVAVDTTLLVPHLWVNGNMPWDSTSRNFVDSRMNVAGVWVTGGAPNGEWVGFARQVTVATGRWVLIGMCADNRFRFSLNGTMLVDNGGNIAGGPNFNFMNIYPVFLPSGVNFIEMYGVNDGSVAGFAVEIYDCTVAQLAAVTTEAQLDDYIIFSSKDMFGQNFDLGTTVGYHCDPGWVLDNSDPDPDNWVCKQIVRTDPTMKNTGLLEYADRRRLANGTPDGYTEANDLDGIGPFIPPVEDHDTCAIDETTDICIVPIFSAGAVTFYAVNGGAPFSVPNNVVIEWMYQIDGGAWVLAPDQTILNGTNASNPYVIPGGGGDVQVFVILSFTPDADGVYNYQQCLPE